MSQYPQHPYQSAPGRQGQWYPGPGPGPGYGGPVPPPVNGGKRKRNRWLVVGVVVAVVVVAAAGGVWVWQRQGGAGGIAADAGVRLALKVEEKIPDDWKTEGDEVQLAVGSLIDGRWWTDGHLVREMPNEVVAYDLANGSVAWRVPVAGSGSCRSSQEMSPEGYVAILRGDGLGSKAKKGCHQLTLVDTKAGKEAWTVELDEVGGKFPSVDTHPVITGGLVHLSSDMGAQSRALADGARSDRMAQPQGCAATDYQGVDGVLVAWLRCRSGDERLWVLAGYDENLKPLWGWLHPEKGRKPGLKSVLSLDPLTVVVDGGRAGQEIWRVEPGDGTPADPGKHSVLLTPSEKISQPCLGGSNSTGLDVCNTVVAGDGVLYLRSNPNGISSRFHGIIAMDMKTGKERWHARAEGELSLDVVTLDDGRLIAYQAQAELSTAKDLGYESPGTVVALDPGNGGLTALASIPQIEFGQPWETLVERGEHGTDFLEWHDDTLAFLPSAVVVASGKLGGGPGSLAALVFS